MGRTRLPTRTSARELVKSLYLSITKPTPNRSGCPVTFSDIAEHYCDMELPDDQTTASIPKAHSTIATYKRYLAGWVLPCWGEETALTIQPLELES